MNLLEINSDALKFNRKIDFLNEESFPIKGCEKTLSITNITFPAKDVGIMLQLESLENKKKPGYLKVLVLNHDIIGYVSLTNIHFLKTFK